MEIRVPLSDMDYGPEEEQAVLDVIRSRWLTMGAVTQEFESEFARFLGVKHAFAVSNGTHALHLACLAAGLGTGTEAIVPSLTFVASANAVLYTGAEVRFADINDETDLNICVEDIERQITPHTRAIMLVHYGGFPCRMGEILALAQRYHLAVIEDAAHAPGAQWDGQMLGTIGDLGCFSFFSNKNLATGEGGMVVTNRDDYAEKIKLMRSHGMTSLTWDRHRGHAFTYDVVALGYNDRIDEIHSALGLAQLKKLPRNNARRAQISAHYRQAFCAAEFAGIQIPFEHSQGQSSYHIFPVLLPSGFDRQQFMKSLREQGIQSSIHYPPIHKFSYYQQRYPRVSLPRTEEIASREVTLPLYPGMTDEMVDWVISAVKKSFSVKETS